MNDWVTYSPELEQSERRQFLRGAREVAEGNLAGARRLAVAALPPASASIHVLCDLGEHGWEVVVEGRESGRRKTLVRLQRPKTTTGPEVTRDRVRAQHLRARDEQLRKPSVARFVESMERVRNHRGTFVSVFSLMRDGAELAAKLRDAKDLAEQARAAALQALVSPYIQVVAAGEVCGLTGLRLNDIWRYFRLTWASHYTSVPGRSMAFIVRDASAKHHPVIGIGAIGSAVVQSTVRDDWLGWTPSNVVNDMQRRPIAKDARWLDKLTHDFLNELFIEDFLEEGLVSVRDLKSPRSCVAEALEAEAERAKRQHHANYEPGDYDRGIGRATDSKYWEQRARTDLFRSKRAELLAMLLRVRSMIDGAFNGKPTAWGLRRLLSTSEGRHAVRSIVRRKKSETVGVCIADITVCGAIPPYSHLTGGKLVGMLAASPEIVNAYRDRYGGSASIIASSLAGKEVVRKPDLVALSTTSLYGVVPNQYTRLSIPLSVVGGQTDEALRFEKLGITVGFGTFHLTKATREALWNVVQQRDSRAVVNWLFGEGVNPRLRGLREAMDRLKLPANEILNHGSSKVVYGIRLAHNATSILLGKERRPKFILPLKEAQQTSSQIASYWVSRWMLPRVEKSDVLQRIERETLVHPICHGARVIRAESERRL